MANFKTTRSTCLSIQIGKFEMREALTPKQFVWFLIFIALLALVLFVVNRGSRDLHEAEFDSKIVALSDNRRSLCPSLLIKSADPSADPMSVAYCPKEWSAHFDEKMIEVGMIARKNANSDTISFLDSNRRYTGFVIIK